MLVVCWQAVLTYIFLPNYYIEVNDIESKEKVILSHVRSI